MHSINEWLIRGKKVANQDLKNQTTQDKMLQKSWIGVTQKSDSQWSYKVVFYSSIIKEMQVNVEMSKFAKIDQENVKTNNSRG